MSKIENKQTNLVLNVVEDKPVFAGYFDLVKICVINSSSNGLTVAEIKERLKLSELIETQKEGEPLEVTPEQTRLIKTSVAAFKWTQPHKDIVEFGDYIEALK